MRFVAAIVLILCCYFENNALAFAPLTSTTSSTLITSNGNKFLQVPSRLFTFYEGRDPSDYDPFETLPGEKTTAALSTAEDDALIRDTLKRELLLLSSITNRGECAVLEEQNLLIDLVSQLEALNPTPSPARQAFGEWDLCLASTQLFRTSPFFQTIRVLLNAQIAENAFDLHDKATTAGRIGRVRQIITFDKLVSEVDLEVGILPGLPFRVKGTVVTTASLSIVSDEAWDLQILETTIRGSNIPFINQVLEDVNFDIPMNTLYQSVRGDVPIVPTKTFYIDEGMRISRDIDDNFFVWTRV